MARRKTVKTEPTELTQQATKDAAEALAAAFDKLTIEKYGALNPPSPYLTPMGVRPLDSLLGGGLASSAPIAFSSTAETGKSSIAFQFAKQFLNFHKNSLVVYFDVESNAAELELGETTVVYQESRAETFGLAQDGRFRYNRKPFTIKEFFEYLEELVQTKRQFQQQIGAEVKILFVLDSITALSYSRIDAVEDFDKIPGKRAAELSFYLTKWKQNFAYDRITMITIDQLKAAMSLKSQYEQADEKTVGTWRNTKAATGVYTFQHMVAQWLFFSKGTEINPSKFPGWNIDGWLIDVRTEKNKNSSSQHSITVVFDKRNGIDKFWSEFLFISDHTPSEKKMFRDGKVEEFYPLAIKTEGAYSKLEVVNPETGEVDYESKKFYKKNAKTLYEEDEEFHKWFDIAVDYSCKERITKGLLKVDTSRIDENYHSSATPIFEEEESMKNDQEQEIITEYEQPSAEIEKPKKRGRPGRKKKAVAESSNDEFLENSSIIEE